MKHIICSWQRVKNILGGAYKCIFLFMGFVMHSKNISNEFRISHFITCISYCTYSTVLMTFCIAMQCCAVYILYISRG